MAQLQAEGKELFCLLLVVKDMEKTCTANLECLIKCCPVSFHGEFSAVSLFFLSHIRNLQWAYWALLRVGWPLPLTLFLHEHRGSCFHSLVLPVIRAASLRQHLKFTRSCSEPAWGNLLVQIAILPGWLDYASNNFVQHVTRALLCSSQVLAGIDNYSLT